MEKPSFYERRDIQNRKKTGHYLDNLPEFVYDFFIGVESNTSSLTRYNYAMDFNVFFDYLAEYVFKKPMQDITAVFVLSFSL